MRILLVGEESAGVQALKLLAARELDVVAVLAAEGQERGSSVAGLAAQLGLPRRDPALVRDPAFAAWVAEQQVDLLLNVHSLHIAHGDVLAAPRIGSFNLHNGPLPRYAGLNAPSWAIYEGQRRHAVTLHWMDAAVDAGAIAYDAWFEIDPRDSALRVSANCVAHGVPLLERLLDDAARGRGAIPARPQATTGGHWYGRGVPHDGRLPWSLPARRVVDLVRACDYAPFPSPWGTPVATLDGGARIAVERAAATGLRAGERPGTIGAGQDGGVPVAAADEWVLVQRVRRDGAAVEPEAALVASARFIPEPHDPLHSGG